MFKRVLVAIGIMVLVLNVFSGTGISATREITMWMSKSRESAMNEMVKTYWKEFERTFPGVKVRGVIMREEEFYQKLPAAIEGKAPPDVTWMVAPILHPYVQAGLVMDLSPLYEEITSRGGGIVEEPARRATSRQNKYWAIPFSYAPCPLYYRKDLLAKAGVPLPTTLDEFLEACPKVHDPPNVYAFAQSYGTLETDSEVLYYPVMWSFGGSYIAEDGVTVVFDSPENLKAFDWIRHIYEDLDILPPGVASWGSSDNNKLYQAGKTAFTINALSVYGWAVKNDPELVKNTGLGPWFAGPRGSFTVGTTEVLAIFKTTKDPILAKNLVRFFLDIERYEKLMETSGGYHMPIFNDLRKLPFWTEGPIGGAVDCVPYISEPGTGYPGPVTGTAGMVWSGGVLPDVVHKIILNKWTVEKALAWGQKRIEGIYSEFPPGL